MTKRQEAVTIIANAGGVAWATVSKAVEYLPHGTFADEIGTDDAGGQEKAAPCPDCGAVRPPCLHKGNCYYAGKGSAAHDPASPNKWRDSPKSNPDETSVCVFLDQSDHIQSYWIAEADEFLSSQKWSWHTDSADAIFFSTAIYLYHMSQLLNRVMTYPCYVVHSQDHDWRFVSSDYAPAFKRFKSSIRRGERVGLFHWIHANKCERIGVGNEYALTRDYHIDK